MTKKEMLADARRLRKCINAEMKRLRIPVPQRKAAYYEDVGCIVRARDVPNVLRHCKYLLDTYEGNVKINLFLGEDTLSFVKGVLWVGGAVDLWTLALG